MPTISHTGNMSTSSTKGTRELASKVETTLVKELDKKLEETDSALKILENKIFCLKKMLRIIQFSAYSKGFPDELPTRRLVTTRFSKTKKQQQHEDKNIPQPPRMPLFKMTDNLVEKDSLKPDISLKVEKEGERHVWGRRFKELRRFEIGNVSQFLPEERRNDGALYRWMLYVRGPRDDSDISKYVSKVQFYLHPTYCPNVVEVMSPPFHLQRQGWGEFTVRIIIHFKITRNRPVTIFYNLQLDRTQCGLQRVGKEIVFEEWLYSDYPENFVGLKDYNCSTSDESNICVIEDGTTSCDNDRTAKSIRTLCETYLTSVLVQLILCEHSYASTEIYPKNYIKYCVNINKSKSILSCGGRSVLKSSAERKLVSLLKIFPELQKKEPTSEDEDCSQIFKNAAARSSHLPCEQAVSLLLRHLPAVTVKACSSDYRTFHPYAAKSADDYRSWNIARQSAAQHYRARMIKNVLLERSSCTHEPWTCRKIKNFARLFGYCPFPKVIFVQNDTAGQLDSECNNYDNKEEILGIVRKSSNRLLIDADPTNVFNKCDEHVKHLNIGNTGVKISNIIKRNRKSVIKSIKSIETTHKSLTGVKVSENECPVGVNGETGDVNEIKEAIRESFVGKKIMPCSSQQRNHVKKEKHQFDFVSSRLNSNVEMNFSDSKSLEFPRKINKVNSIKKRSVTTKLTNIGDHNTLNINMKKLSSNYNIFGTCGAENERSRINRLCKRNRKLAGKEAVAVLRGKLLRKRTLCEPQKIVSYISTNEDCSHVGRTEDLTFIDILKSDSTSHAGDSQFEDMDGITELEVEREELCSFVRKSAKWLNIWKGLKPKHFTESEILVAIAGEVFMEDLLRRSLSFAWSHYSVQRNLPITIYKNDVILALRKRKEYDILSNCGLGFCQERE